MQGVQVGIDRGVCVCLWVWPSEADGNTSRLFRGPSDRAIKSEVLYCGAYRTRVGYQTYSPGLFWGVLSGSQLRLHACRVYSLWVCPICMYRLLLLLFPFIPGPRPWGVRFDAPQSARPPRRGWFNQVGLAREEGYPLQVLRFYRRTAGYGLWLRSKRHIYCRIVLVPLFRCSLRTQHGVDNQVVSPCEIYTPR